MGNEWKCRIQPPFFKKKQKQKQTQKAGKGQDDREALWPKGGAHACHPCPSPLLGHRPCWILYPCPQFPTGHLEFFIPTISCISAFSPGLLTLSTALAQSFRWESPRHLGECSEE